MTTVQLRIGADDEWGILTFPYDRDVIAIVKSLPSYDRGWDGERKQWRVRSSACEQLIDMFTQNGHTVTDGTRAPAPEPGLAAAVVDAQEDFFSGGGADAGSSESVDAKLHAKRIIDGLPEHLRGRVFRAMGRQLYPDLYARRH